MRTAFTKHNLKQSGKYLLLNKDGQDLFIARFKYSGPITMAKFKKELIANHNVEDYLYELNVKHKAPLDILRTKNLDWYNKQIKQFKDKYVH
jgi:hypothetical protein